MNLGQLIEANNNYYQLYRVIKEPKTLPNEMVNELKDLWLCTHTFRKDGMLYFCREVESIPFKIIN
jgi:hypothetical protein